MKENRLLKKIFIYSIGSLLPRAISFLLLPLYTAHIPPVDYGYYDLVISALDFLLPACSFMIWDTMLRFFFDSKSDKEQSQVAATGVFFALIASILATIVYFSVTNFVDIRSPILIFSFSVTMLFSYIWHFATRGLGNSKLFMIIGVIGSFVNVISNIVLIIYFGMGLEALLISQTLSQIIIIAIAELRLKIIKEIRIKNFKKELFKRMLMYSWPMAVYSIAIWVQTTSNRFIINSQLGVEANGYFAIANKLGSILLLAGSVFYLAWQEEAYTEAQSNDLGKYMSDIFDKYFRFMFGACIVLIPLTNIIFAHFINNSYENALELLPSIYVGIMLFSLSKFLDSPFRVKMKTPYIMYTALIGGIISIGASLLFIGKYGLLSVSWSLTFGYLITILLRAYFAHRLIDIKYNVPILAFLLIICFVIMTIYLFFENAFLDLFFVGSGILIALFINRQLIQNLFLKLKSLKP